MTKPRKPVCPLSPQWRKSSCSQGGGTECVEVAEAPGHWFVRDSKDPDGPTLIVAPSAWSALLAAVKTGAHDLP
ncbi:DUF397 domain-containing protein [Actinomadura sp. WMMB 499]|uniref:DUF397 domain-containing protein n=1 Tax=Actinomadura sp. WMMB 499 TaxID=1219491 RepID=UPI001247ED73|nr:DUF397 domain-containing protein [Actinomadura sp. WMMB 499]QFG20988.1 DUF397 domain-containing protein [Actinomadura sp. WMMB 499]